MKSRFPHLKRVPILATHTEATAPCPLVINTWRQVQLTAHTDWTESGLLKKYKLPEGYYYPLTQTICQSFFPSLWLQGSLWWAQKQLLQNGSYFGNPDVTRKAALQFHNHPGLCLLVLGPGEHYKANHLSGNTITSPFPMSCRRTNAPASHIEKAFVSFPGRGSQYLWHNTRHKTNLVNVALGIEIPWNTTLSWQMKYSAGKRKSK